MEEGVKEGMRWGETIAATTPPAARRSAVVGTPCTSQGATTTRGHGTPPLTHCAPLAGASPLGSLLRSVNSSVLQKWSYHRKKYIQYF